MSDPAPAVPVQLAHVSDLHIGYTAYRATSANGDNQRSVDVAQAAARCFQEIRAADPPLVLCSGDVGERPNLAVRWLLALRQQFAQLAGMRPDGTRRQLIIIAGNHDQPAQHRESCFLELYADLPGVHVVTRDVGWIHFDVADDPELPSEIDGFSVCAVPHDTLKDLTIDGRFDEITPRKGRRNLLMAHGVAGGSRLYRRSLGREFNIPTDVLADSGWEYVALGHYHRQGPVAMSGGPEEGASRVWYAGSTENMGFGDMLDNGTRRGWLSVTVEPGVMPKVERRNVKIRSMFRLPVVDGAGMSPQQITDELHARVAKAAADGTIAGAVVGQIVKGVPREVWGLVDLASVRDAAKAALHYDVTVEPVVTARDENDTEIALGDVGRVLGERADAMLDENVREPALALARELLGQFLTDVATDDDNDTTEPSPITSTAAKADAGHGTGDRPADRERAA